MGKNDQENPKRRWNKKVPYKTPPAPWGSIFFLGGGGLQKRPFVPIFTAAPILTISFYTYFLLKKIEREPDFFSKKEKKE